MDPQLAQVIDLLRIILPTAAIIVVVAVGGSLLNNWLKIRNGYPLSNSWGLPIHPKNDRETVERVKLLTNENAQLRAELGSIKDRLETLERIATDQPARLARDIDALAIDKGGNA
ncbi:MAG TPA: hypothetical protein VFI67_07120 [Sphingomicrobium sp.]|jgi:hypothetical protein|nr:hypothetical protein [Sphingomicrobium sp.]